MKRRMILAIAIMAVMLAPLYAQSEDDFDVKQNVDNTLTITGYKGTAKNVVIPGTIYGLTVSIIGKEAFHNKGITSVVIPDTVISIENGAFSYNAALRKVTLGKGLKTIGDYSFRNTGLTEVIIPDSATSIGKGAFMGEGWIDGWGKTIGEKGKLTKVTFGTGLQTIGESAFSNNQITELTLPPSLKEIGGSAFSENTLTKVTFGSGLQTIGGSAFSDNQISELQLPPSLKTIPYGAFKNNKIQKITFGTGLQTIGNQAFRNNLITELTLPSSLKEIGIGAFADNQIKSVNIPNGVTSIRSNYNEPGAFANNPLTAVVIPPSLGSGGISITSYGKGDLIFGTTSTIASITIPAGMNENILNKIFEETFVNFWINQNKAGGTYIKRGPIWTKEDSTSKTGELIPHPAISSAKDSSTSVPIKTGKVIDSMTTGKGVGTATVSSSARGSVLCIQSRYNPPHPVPANWDRVGNFELNTYSTTVSKREASGEKYSVPIGGGNVSVTTLISFADIWDYEVFHYQIHGNSQRNISIDSNNNGRPTIFIVVVWYALPATRVTMTPTRGVTAFDDPGGSSGFRAVVQFLVQEDNGGTKIINVSNYSRGDGQTLIVGLYLK